VNDHEKHHATRGYLCASARRLHTHQLPARRIKQINHPAMQLSKKIHDEYVVEFLRPQYRRLIPISAARDSIQSYAKSMRPYAITPALP
jgi:hypothetical protein